MQVLEKIMEEIESEYLMCRCQNNKVCDYPESIGCCYDRAIGKVLDIICKHMNGGWIPVGERLPGKHVRYVWITVDHGTIQQRILAKWGGEKFRSIYGGEFCGRIVAWKECDVPEPYRPERSE